MMVDDDVIHGALSEIAGTAVDPQLVLDRIHRARARRRWVHQAATVTGAGLAVGGLFAGVSWLHEAGREAGLPPEGSPAVSVSAPPSASRTTTAAPASPRPAGGPSRSDVTVPVALQRAFDGAGYHSADALTLASLWRTDDPTLAEAVAGRAILDGKPLPIRPGEAATSDSKDLTDVLIGRYFAEGLDYTDANELARHWNVSDIYTAKVLAGQMIQDGRVAEVKALLAKP
jgi:hypothetical protein